MNLDWIRLLKLKTDEVFGLDIGTSAVKLIQMRRDKAGWAVTAAGFVEISDGSENNERLKETNTIKAVSRSLESTGVRAPFAVCSVCGPEVAVRPFKFPSLPPEEIPGAVQLEASQVCPFNIDDGVVDYQLIPNGQNSVNGVLVAATDKLIRRKSKLAEDVSVSTVLMDVDGLALLNCFGECEKSHCDQTIAILNIGSSYTNLAIIGDDGLPFVRDIAYAGDEIIKQIAARHNISPETVRAILSGCEDSGQHQLQLADSLPAACEKLIVDVADTLRYYSAQEKSASVEEVFVCGGFAMAEGFVELLDNQLTAAVVLWNPFDKIACGTEMCSSDILRKNGPAMAVAAGLAMRSI